MLADRLRDYRYFANLFRLYLHTAAYNLLVHMRHEVVDPPPVNVVVGTTVVVSVTRRAKASPAHGADADGTDAT